MKQMIWLLLLGVSQKPDGSSCVPPISLYIHIGIYIGFLCVRQLFWSLIIDFLFMILSSWKDIAISDPKTRKWIFWLSIGSLLLSPLPFGAIISGVGLYLGRHQPQVQEGKDKKKKKEVKRDLLAPKKSKKEILRTLAEEERAWDKRLKKHKKNGM